MIHGKEKEMNNFKCWLMVFAKIISVVFVLSFHAIAFARCFKIFEANDDSDVKFLIGVLVFTLIVSGLLFIISFAIKEINKRDEFSVGLAKVCIIITIFTSSSINMYLFGISKIVPVLILVAVAVWIVISKRFECFGGEIRYISKESVSAGIIMNNEKKKTSFDFDCLSMAITKTISAAFVLVVHAIAMGRCFKTFEASSDSDIRFFMAVSMFAVIVSGLLFIIWFAKNEVEK